MKEYFKLLEVQVALVKAAQELDAVCSELVVGSELYNGLADISDELTVYSRTLQKYMTL